VESQVDLSRYSNSWYRPGPFWKRAIWFVVNVVFFRNPLSPSSAVKRVVLRAFGARIGTGVVIKPGVSIKYPWFLSIVDLIVGNIVIGDGAWIGACSVVAPSVTVGDHAVLTVGSVASSDLARRGVYRGNPAVLVRPRKLAE